IVGRTVLNIAKDPTNIQGKRVTLGPADAPLAPGAGTAAAASGRTYVTQPGDTLSGISKKFYGKATLWKRIADANPQALSDPAKLRAGVELVIPE
ncbi:MAG: LysM peptidoglycan-binding domain-containing protein, partial [Phycisphaerales bacterium]|nr:LysM peptidoglycan-binding domain-containing protein [Phycisphaerales bacterium]